MIAEAELILSKAGVRTGALLIFLCISVYVAITYLVNIVNGLLFGESE